MRCWTDHLVVGDGHGGGGGGVCVWGRGSWWWGVCGGEGIVVVVVCACVFKLWLLISTFKKKAETNNCLLKIADITDMY